MEWTLTFIGTVLDFDARDSKAINYRLAQATKVFYKWRHILQCRLVPVSVRAKLTTTTVFQALLWLSETWHPTVEEVKRLNSWGARIFARVAGIRPKVDDAEGDFWRRMHRFGHGLMTASGGNVDTFRRRRLHSFAGHIARATGSVANVALHTRSLAWWRAFQGRQLLKHPRRFYPWRWEEQLTSHYGEEASFFIDEAVGWMRKAQNRSTWKELESAFGES